MDSYGNIYPLTNPLVLGTAAFAVAGWLIAFIGACVAAFHGVTWWIIIFELFFTVGMIVAIGVGGFGPHRGLLLTLLAISIVYLTYLIPIVYYEQEQTSGAKATLGGLIILIIMQYLWVFLLGCSEESKLYSLFYGGRHGGGLPRINAPMIQRNFVSPSQNKENPLPQTPANNNNNPPIPQAHQEHQKFPTASALHSYQANPEDPNELTFSKDETLEILDRKGNWWQAKKADGSVGIVPSNYFSS
ncbi:hypothetical protein BDB00DRAFT_876779 [Zychaea mexicana]|uniref:uncharacterized protein n=1 Tax=Zychaea mexicana TaxID=64656 RepID=UPI0022FE3A75|nr:uncharacterized protein BDB00DRAFT_876779 [Zychaea mexicana]KAI9489110.1 hypothetical protein BDB00DRAFT_876779 [Zychaea mexicana]